MLTALGFNSTYLSSDCLMSLHWVDRVYKDYSESEPVLECSYFKWYEWSYKKGSHRAYTLRYPKVQFTGFKEALTRAFPTEFTVTFKKHHIHIEYFPD